MGCDRWKNEFFSSIVDANDDFPFKYYHDEQEIIDKTCSKHMYLSDQMAILSAVRKMNDNSFDHIWSCYDWSVWIAFILITLLSIIITMRSREMRNQSGIQSFLSSLWIHFEPLLGEGNVIKHKSLLYLCYLLALFPLIIIFENELLAKLVSNQKLRFNSVEEILAHEDMNPKVNYRHNKYFYKNQTDKLEDSILKRELSAFENRISVFTMTELSNIIDNPEKVIDYFERLVILGDDFSIRFIKVSNHFYYFRLI